MAAAITVPRNPALTEFRVSEVVRFIIVSPWKLAFALVVSLFPLTSIDLAGPCRSVAYRRDVRAQD
jgi:hypothetical protein